MLDSCDLLTVHFSSLDQTQKPGALFLEGLHENGAVAEEREQVLIRVTDSRARLPRVQPRLSLLAAVIMGKLFHLPVPQFPHL